MSLYDNSVVIVSVVVLLFFGIYMTSTISDSLFPESSLYDFSYATLTNSTSQQINTTLNASYSFDIGTFADDIEWATPRKEITTSVLNTNTSAQTVTVYLNDVSVGSFSAAGSTTTAHTFSSVAWVESATNNVTYEVG
jgi:hypothetical protein